MMDGKSLDRCHICPRECGAKRDDLSGDGFCKAGKYPKIAKATLHFWEEPPISGERGSGAVFFSGCSMRCVYCQNYKISTQGYGKEVTPERLREIYEELKGQGAHNINLVNPTHYAEVIAKSLEKPLEIPVIYNCGGYEKVDTLRKLEGKIQIYMPDLKYSDNEAAKRYSKADGYFETAKAAIDEMFRQTGEYEIDEEGILRKGVVIRHLVLPNNLKNTCGVIDYVSSRFKPGEVLFSLMSQYIPFGEAEKYPEISGRLSEEEYAAAKEYLEESNIEDGFVQELASADEGYVPDFNLSGV